MDVVFVILERAGGSFGMSPMRAIRLAEAVAMKARGRIAARGGTVVEDASFGAFAADEIAVIILPEQFSCCKFSP